MRSRQLPASEKVSYVSVPVGVASVGVSEAQTRHLSGTCTFNYLTTDLDNSLVNSHTYNICPVAYMLLYLCIIEPVYIYIHISFYVFVFLVNMYGV